MGDYQLFTKRGMLHSLLGSGVAGARIRKRGRCKVQCAFCPFVGKHMGRGDLCSQLLPSSKWDCGRAARHSSNSHLAGGGGAGEGGKRMHVLRTDGLPKSRGLGLEPQSEVMD